MTSTGEACAPAATSRVRRARRAAQARRGDIGPMVGSKPPMPRRFRFAALLALLAASAALLGGCGGSEPSANELLRQTFGPNQGIDSGRLALALAFDGQGLRSVNGPVSLRLVGPFQSSGKGKLPKVDLSLTVGMGGTTFSAGAVSTGDRGWLRLQGTTFAVDAPTFRRFKQGYEQAASRSGGRGTAPTLRSLGIDPLRWLTDPRLAGSARVGGADTRHITAGVNVGRFLDDVDTLLGRAGQLGRAAGSVPSRLTPQQRRDIEASVRRASLDVWTGSDDKKLRRLKLTIDVAVPPAVRARAGGLRAGTLTFDVTISDLNAQQRIVAPSNARPLSQLRQLLGAGAVGATPAPQPATPQPATPPGGSSSKYLDCVARASGDVAKIQKCAALAGQ